MPMSKIANSLSSKAVSVRVETVKVHIKAPATRIASSLSSVEIFVCLFYSGLMKFDPKNPKWIERDRLIVSKGHGSICMYPILADLGFFDKSELEKAGEPESFLGGIPDPSIPGYDTINGSLGHGLGIGVGTALYLRNKKATGHDLNKVFVVISDGELYEGSTWEALMLAGSCKLENLIVIIDNNKTSMLDRTENIIPLINLNERLNLCGWRVIEVDGHDLDQIHDAVSNAKSLVGAPTIINANTVKGKGVARLEKDPLSHIANLDEGAARLAIDEILGAGVDPLVVGTSDLTNEEKLAESNF
jgi:transketolase